ncbi:ABC transporter substrate-binding protein [Phytohabitans suffuscus]|uniref:Ribose ABC transporter substrate-binding protein n=1 Tax=Phytohabitans suffuscus TaxID=624315 RepID=A0A6F8YYJ7_9ACTN|nr:ABC transporter substrate-binding protein [Phytohabitans suffuscus]BCB91152.1 ribose ABC transporter substrate-binding protein [Phytohabitans suffuscus]
MRHIRFGAAAAATLLALSLAACGDGSGDGGTGSAGDSFDIAFIPGVANDAYYGSVACGIQAVAAKSGSTVETQAPKSFSPTDQIPILQAVIAKKPDVIIIAPTDSKALYAPLRQATSQGIKVVLVDTTLEDPSLAEAEVSSDNVEAGKVAAQKLVELLGGRSGSVLTVNLSAGVTTTDDREKGFAEGLASAPGLKYLGQQFSNNSVQTAASIVSATLAANADLTGIFSTAAFNTEGAVAALRSANAASRVTIVGFNANPPGVQQIEDGTVAAQVVLKPYDEGVAAAEQAINALTGEPVTKQISTGAVVATKDNLQTPEVQKYLYSFDCPAA